MRSLRETLRVRRSDAIALAVLVGATLLVYAGVIAGTKGLLVLGDNAQQTVAWYAFANRSFHSGFLPLWDPYQFAGHSFVGDAQSGVFYPLNHLLFAAAGEQLGSKGISPFLLAHVFLAGLFQYWLLRVLKVSSIGALTGALVFALGGFLLHRITAQANIFLSAVWLPLAFLLFHQALHRSLLFAPWAGAAVAVSLLAGHIQPPAFTSLTLVGYAAWFALTTRRRADVQRAAAAVVFTLAVTAGLSAIQLLPSLEYQEHAYRFVGAGPPYDAASRLPYDVVGYHYLLEPKDLGGFFSPAFGQVDDGRPYIGVVTLVLAALGLTLRPRRIVAFWGVLAALALVYSLGHYGGLHHLAYLTVPLLDKIREPIRALYILHFALAVLAGYGVAALASRSWWRTPGALGSLWRRIPLVAAGIGAMVVIATSIDGRPADSDAEGLVTAVGLFSLVGGLIAARALGGARARLVAPLCVAAVILDLVATGWAAFPDDTYDGVGQFSPGAYYARTPVTQYLRAQPGPFRVDNPQNALPVNVGDYEGIELVGGYGATMHKSLYDFFQAPGSASRGADFLNIRYAVTTQPIEGWNLVMSAGPQQLYENRTGLPRVWISHRWEIARGRKAAMTRAIAPRFPARREVVLERQPGIEPSTVDATPDSARVVNYEQSRIDIEARATRPGLLVASEIWYPGWKAEVDGRPAPILRANGLLRVVALPSGSHRVTMTYRPTHFGLALMITLGTLVAVLTASALAWRRQRRRR